MPAGWVQGAGALLGVGESIAGNSAAASAAKANNANAAELSGAQNTMLNQAQSVANQPFVPYTGQLTAPMSGNQQQANTLASQAAATQAGQADVNSATGLLGSEQPWNQQTEQQYANPYTQDVINAGLAQQNKSYLQSLAQQQTGTAATDSFGNARNAIEESNLTAANTLNAATLTTNDNANAYNAALQAWQSNNQAKNQAANAYLAAGNDVTNMTSDQISDLLKTGNVAQVISQTNLTNQYNQFLRQQGWSAQQLQPLISAVSAAKGGTTQSAPVQSNIGNQILGLGSTIAGLFGGSGSSTPASSGMFGTSDASQAALGGVAYNAVAGQTSIPSYTPTLNLGQYQVTGPLTGGT
jgi:hypothetical protein